MPFEFEKLEVPDVILVNPEVFEDERGFFLETYTEKAFEEAGIHADFIQDNHSKSKYGVLRGLHFQKEPYTQAKLVRCVEGVVYDVAVDLREASSTFGEYVAVILSGRNKKMLYIPRGFAHGFEVLSETAEVTYKVDNDYAPEREGGLLWNDPDVAIPWPNKDPILSDKDEQWPTLEELINKGEIF